jgi:superfamily II DNA or RNA helicase
MLPPRFLLADDPGAGKTIMAGLLIKELLIRGDLDRCLIVAHPMALLKAMSAWSATMLKFKAESTGFEE